MKNKTKDLLIQLPWVVKLNINLLNFLSSSVYKNIGDSPQSRETFVCLKTSLTLAKVLIIPIR